MDRPFAAIVPTSGTESPTTRLRGPRQALARTLWVTLFALNLVWFGLALVAQVATTLHPCVAVRCVLTPAQAELFHHLGISLGTVAAYYIGMPALIVGASLIMAVLLFWRRSDDWLALVVGLFLVYRVSSFVSGSSSAGVAGPVALSALLNWADAVIFYAVILIFPDGRLVPRWAWLLLTAWALHEALGFILLANGFTATTAVPTWLSLIWGGGYPVLYLSALGVQVYRYRRVSNPRQRQQTKWVVFGFAVALLANILYWIVLPTAVPPLLSHQSLHAGTLLYPVIAYPLYELATLALPISFAIAIQRHQLFDVDVLIRRTLVYGSLTVILAALYFGVVLGAQAVTQRLRGQGEPPIIIVASTLLIAALFTPLRRRIQAIIDRRFYRTRYDAARTLSAFGETLRTETNLSELGRQLMAVVHETMQPASVSLWLRASLPASTDDGTGVNDLS